MSFTSVEFLLFFPLVVLTYNLVPRSARLYFLLGVSYLMMGLRHPTFLLMLVTTSIITFCFALWIERTKDDIKKRRVMWAGIFFTVTPLLCFKYMKTAGLLLSAALETFGWNITFPEIAWLMPLGISYYTFMSIGYLIDVYNEEVMAEHNPGIVALFLSFFPIVFSGPIERSGNMFPQFSKMERSTIPDITAGARMMLWGYFMKFCIADRIGIYIDPIWGNQSLYGGNTLTLATLLVPLRQYADLGGYSLLAIGTARCIGFRIIPNFRRPFLATSLAALWRRWHMSFIQWLLDYIYTPVSFVLRRWKFLRIAGALTVAFLVSAVWHGATLNNILWGLSQVLILTVEALALKKNRTQRYVFVRMVFTYMLFSFTQVIGATDSVAEIGMVYSKIFSFWNWGQMFFDLHTFVLAVTSLLILAIKDLSEEYGFKMPLLDSCHKPVRLLGTSLLICYILVFGVFNNSSFIYFQF